MAHRPPEQAETGAAASQHGHAAKARSRSKGKPPGARDDAGLAEIVADTSLSRKQQIRMLNDLAQDLVDRQIASQEGMAPPSAETAAAESALLRKVNRCIDELEEGDGGPKGHIARVWSRFTSQ